MSRIAEFAMSTPINVGKPSRVFPLQGHGHMASTDSASGSGTWVDSNHQPSPFYGTDVTSPAAYYPSPTRGVLRFRNVCLVPDGDALPIEHTRAMASATEASHNPNGPVGPDSPTPQWGADAICCRTATTINLLVETLNRRHAVVRAWKRWLSFEMAFVSATTCDKWTHQDLNLGPPPCKEGALPLSYGPMCGQLRQ